MKKSLAVSFALMLAAALSYECLAQTPPPAANTPQFQFNVSVMKGPASSAGVDLGATYGVTANYWLESDNLLFPAVNGGYYGVGVQGTIPKVCELLASTNLNCMKFRPYFVASGGMTRVTVGSLPAVDHAAAMACVGSDYDPTGSGKFTVGLFRICPARLPGLQGGVTMLISSSINLGWGTNAQAAEQNELRRQKMLAKERRHAAKLQRAADKD
jgi:hypothetical protein